MLCKAFSSGFTRLLGPEIPRLGVLKAFPKGFTRMLKGRVEKGFAGSYWGFSFSQGTQDHGGRRHLRELALQSSLQVSGVGGSASWYWI